MKTIALNFGRLLGLLWHPFIVLQICKFYSYVYTGIASRNIKSLGKNSKIREGTQLIGNEYISISENVTIGRYGMVSAYFTNEYCPDITISSGVMISDYCHITSIHSVYIGKNAFIGRFVTITDNSHGELSLSDVAICPMERQLLSKGPVVIGDRVWVGDKVTILPNVKIGTSAIIGANSVVTHDIPAHSIAVGNPAKVVKQI